jgi:hypothetical protein
MPVEGSSKSCGSSLEPGVPRKRGAPIHRGCTLKNHIFGEMHKSSLRRLPLSVGLIFLALGLGPKPVSPQVPRDQVHLSMILGGYVKVGVGFTHWMEEHHALEFTVFPLALPWDGIHVDLKGGYNWIPSDENWRAKLGGNFTLMIHQPSGDGGWFTPLLAFTPGLNYNPEDEKSFRVDLWMSYYLNEKVFAPTGLEVLYGLKK